MRLTIFRINSSKAGKLVSEQMSCNLFNRFYTMVYTLTSDSAKVGIIVEKL